MHHLPRWTLFTAAVVVIALAAIAGVGVGAVRRTLPQTTGEISVPGLRGQVEVLRDAYGVPQIYADNAEDLFEAQGFVHAQDRFWEMDVRRHITAGRLSELFGASQVGTDTFVRTLGWRQVAQQELGVLSAATRRNLDAYASGVNAYLRSAAPADLSLEYSLLGLQGRGGRPEEWTAVDSLSWLKALAWQQGSNINLETDRALVTAAVGATRAAELLPDDPMSGYDPIVTQGTVRDGVFDQSARAGSGRTAPATVEPSSVRSPLQAMLEGQDQLTAWLGRPDGGSVGSNSWVVAGSRTATGKPILSNDPHLDTAMPSAFAQVGLHCRTVSKSCPYDVTGFSFSGLPGVVIGKNARIAWGLTTSYADAQDLYLEQVRGNQVRIGDAWQPLRLRTEQITVAGETQPRTVAIRSSRHGPLVSDANPRLAGVGQRAAGSAEAYAVSLAWTAATPGRTMDALFAIDRASSFAQFRKAASLLSAPSQNLVYADVDGTIGYQLAGALPRRGRGDGTQVSPGWDASYDWRGVVPAKELPYAENPASGFLVTANNRVVADPYGSRLGSEYSAGWRSQQIIDALGNDRRLTVDASAALQTQDTVRFAAEIVPTVLKVKVNDAWVREGQQTLVGWDYSSPADSAAAAFFHILLHDIAIRTFRDQLPAELWPRLSDRTYAALTALVKEPNDPWWDDASTPAVERRDDILLAALGDARREATSLMSRDVAGWSWGRIHTVTLRNQTLGRSGIAPIEQLLNRGPVAVGGSIAAVNAMSFNDQVSYAVTTAPTMRMTVDLAAPDSSVWVNQSGASGHAFDAHYADQFPLWTAGKTWPFLSSRTAVEAATVDRLLLRPAG